MSSDENISVVMVLKCISLFPIVHFGLVEGTVVVIVVPTTQSVEETLVPEFVNHL